jgi:AcrR family transcriptional regulator
VQNGYHAVRMEAIAAKVGISAAALYRHYPSKYDLFRGAVLNLGRQLVESTGDGRSDRDALDRMIQALIDVTLANRDSGGLYRWQARYLRAPDQILLGSPILEGSNCFPKQADARDCCGRRCGCSTNRATAKPAWSKSPPPSVSRHPASTGTSPARASCCRR